MDVQKNNQTQVQSSGKDIIKPKERGLSNILSICALALAGGAAYYTFVQQQKLASYQHDVFTLESDFNTFKASAERAASLPSVSSTPVSSSNLPHSPDSLAQDKYQLELNWALAEARVLANITSDRLVITREISPAIFQLERIEQRVSALLSDKRLDDGDIVSKMHAQALLPAIAKDLAVLKATQYPDKAALDLKLVGLIEKLSTLNLSNPSAGSKAESRSESDGEKSLSPKAETQVTQTATVSTSGWRSTLEQSFSELKSLVRVRKNDQKIALPLVSQEELVQVIQLLKLQLEQARLALMTDNFSAYKDTLASIKAVLSYYFKQDENTVFFIKELDVLSQVSWPEHMPDIEHTLKALQDLNRNLKSTAPKSTAHSSQDEQKVESKADAQIEVKDNEADVRVNQEHP